MLQRCIYYRWSSRRSWCLKHVRHISSKNYKGFTASDLKPIAEKWGLKINEDELKEYAGLTSKIIGGLFQVKEKEYVVPSNRTAIGVTNEDRTRGWACRSNISSTINNGKLSGKTVVVKDTIAVAGLPMTLNSRLLEGYVSNVDANVVQRVLDAGATITGKAMCEDMCMSSSSFTSYPVPVPNPHDESRVAGGSSSGCATLVARGEVDMAIGGDQGGSVRIPASWCGVVGLKPTHGLVPCGGAFGIDTRLDHLGPITKNVHDCALLLEVISGYDGGSDIRQPKNLEIPEYTKEIKTNDAKGFKIGVLKEGFVKCSKEVSATVSDAIERLRLEANCDVFDVSIPEHTLGKNIFPHFFMKNMYRSIFMNENSNANDALSSSLLKHVSGRLKTEFNKVSPTLKMLCFIGELLQTVDTSQYYDNAVDKMVDLTSAYNRVLSDMDVLIMPTIPFLPPKLPAKDVSITEYIVQALNSSVVTQNFNLTGHPALTINSGYVNKLPVGMMLVGKHYDEAMVLKVAGAFEMLQK